MKAKKSTKIWLIAALVLILLGTVIGTVCLKTVGYDWTAFHPDDRFTQETQQIHQSIQDLDVFIQSGSLYIKLTADENPSVTSKLNGSSKVSVDIEDQKLIVRSESTEEMEWYERIWYTQDETITINLTRKEYREITVHSQSADIFVQDQLQCLDANIETNSGDVLCDLKVQQTLNCKSDSGDAEITGTFNNLSVVSASGTIDCNACEAAAISLLTASGECTVRRCTLDQAVLISNSGNVFLMNTSLADTLRVSTHSGDVMLTYCTANAIKIGTTSGNVLGVTNLDWKYAVHTDSGSVLVPTSAGEHACIVRTTSGDVEFLKQKGVSENG
ncbi:MAG: DUF4097 family beta strand repeat protein [Clostridia bacterium]|nr:DUF4097 family beta strand repeat protein [Clostridia bacterium]